VVGRPKFRQPPLENYALGAAGGLELAVVVELATEQNVLSLERPEGSQRVLWRRQGLLGTG
jgi:hypothetical protein